MPSLYPYQKEAVEQLTNPKKFAVIAGMGLGKSACALHWAKTTGLKKWLIITTPSARDSSQWFGEYRMWFGEEPEKSLSSFEVISWAGLAKWVLAHWKEIEQYAFIADEVAYAKSGVSSQRGKAFLQIAKRTHNWAGFTATPGDRWEDFQAYFVAAGYVRGKTEFMMRFCNVQTYKGYPEIVGYNEVETLRKWWEEMTVVPDTKHVEEQLPPERHYTHHFKPDPYYKNFQKTHTTKDGDFLETCGAYCSYARQLCFTKEKKQWLADYLETLGTNTVLFYNFTATGDMLEELAYKSLPKGAKVWRIYGGKHDIPTAETIGKHDIVLCQWQAGSEALNLQFISQWVSVEPCYTYSTSQQARGRIRRIGQTADKIVFHYLVCDDSIETDIYAVLKDKSSFAENEWCRQKNLNLREE